ncbi:transcriptional regulator [Actibacterium mucosum KCTC 23349]|uniref:Transcriptional regulator n=1 Tax=Actibacterium mucosum KCTC 23349 TaxID=1454373 RepID=A0A037ZK52_9RHOB|nr:sugar-binding transcriptional regulator [Actibacterium mucosum]KAJ55897.1 transcriptional regulator [Actibacterium mucosum KCTC 23349]
MPQTDAANLELITQAAWAYYQDGMKQSEIAAMLKVSRASVVNYLAEARARGYVRVTMHPDVFMEHQLGRELADAFNLEQALVVPDGPTPDSSLRRVAKAAADWLPKLLSSGDRLGVSWGQTVYEVAEVASRAPIEGLTVVQLVGSQVTPLGFAAETCSANLARAFQAECVNLHAPLVLSTADLAYQLSREPVIAQQLQAVRHCNKTIFAAGSCSEDSHVVASGVVTQDELRAFRRKGAAAVICGRFIDADGAPIPAEVDERMIGVTLPEMQNKETGLLVASGIDRAAPARAAILGGYVSHFVTDVSTARDLMARA